MVPPGPAKAAASRFPLVLSLCPSAGGGYDALALAGSGRETVGLDISETAVRRARALQRERGVPEAACTFALGDFFTADVVRGVRSILRASVPRWPPFRVGAGSLSTNAFPRPHPETSPSPQTSSSCATQKGRFDVIFDYTFFWCAAGNPARLRALPRRRRLAGPHARCAVGPRLRSALPPSLRPAWAARTAALLAPGGVLYTLQFPLGAFEGGPPFAVSREAYSEARERGASRAGPGKTQRTRARGSRAVPNAAATQVLAAAGLEEAWWEPLPPRLSHRARAGREALAAWVPRRHPGAAGGGGPPRPVLAEEKEPPEQQPQAAAPRSVL